MKMNPIPAPGGWNLIDLISYHVFIHFARDWWRHGQVIPFCPVRKKGKVVQGFLGKVFFAKKDLQGRKSSSSAIDIVRSAYDTCRCHLLALRLAEEKDGKHLGSLLCDWAIELINARKENFPLFLNQLLVVVVNLKWNPVSMTVWFFVYLFICLCFGGWLLRWRLEKNGGEWDTNRVMCLCVCQVQYVYFTKKFIIIMDLSLSAFFSLPCFPVPLPLSFSNSFPFSFPHPIFPSPFFLLCR